MCRNENNRLSIKNGAQIFFVSPSPFIFSFCLSAETSWTPAWMTCSKTDDAPGTNTSRLNTAYMKAIVHTLHKFQVSYAVSFVLQIQNLHNIQVCLCKVTDRAQPQRKLKSKLRPLLAAEVDIFGWKVLSHLPTCVVPRETVPVCLNTCKSKKKRKKKSNKSSLISQFKGLLTF